VSLYEDTLQGLNEVLDYTKGKLQLKTTVIEVPDEEVMVVEAADDAFCLQLANDYENDTEDNKMDVMSIQDFSRELEIVLNG